MIDEREESERKMMHDKKQNWYLDQEWLLIHDAHASDGQLQAFCEKVAQLYADGYTVLTARKFALENHNGNR